MESLSLTDRQTALHILDRIEGESFKNLDKLTKFDLLPLYPSIEWKEVKGVRDVIAHHYFDIDANEIFSIINNDFDSLKDAVRFFKEVLADK